MAGLPDWREPKGRIAWIVLVVTALLVIPPIVILIQTSFSTSTLMQRDRSFTVEHYVKLFSDSGMLLSTMNSIIFAALSTVISLLFGGVLAWLVERTDAPFKPLAYVTTIVSMGTPYVLYVAAWLYLLGRAGPFNDVYRLLTGSSDTLFNVYSMTGMVLVEGFLWSPLVFLMMTATFRVANADMEEAARMSGASVMATVWRVSLPLALPAILAMAMFVFIRNIESFDVPVLIGTPGGINLMTTDIYFSMTQIPPDLGHASSFAVLMLVVVSVLLHFYGRLSRNAARFASVTGKGYRPRPFRLGKSRGIAGALILFYFVLILLLPFLALLWSSLMPFVRPMRPAALSLLTLDNFRAVLNASYYVQLASNTLITAAGAATIAMVITVLAGWLAARRASGGGLIDQIVTIPLIFPGIVLGVAMMQVALQGPLPIYGTLWIITIAFVVRYMPYGMRYSYSGVLQIHRELEEAAQVGGASPLATLRRVVMPLLSPAIISGWLFIFLLAAKELSMSVLLAGPRSQVMAVAMFDLWTNGQGGELAAFGLVWAALMTCCGTLFYFTSRRRASETFGG